MTYKGVIENGQVKLDEPADAPNGVRVEVRILQADVGIPEATSRTEPARKFALDDFAGILQGVDVTQDPLAKLILEKHS